MNSLAKSSFIREITLYRFRYVIGYGFFTVLLFSLLLFGLNDFPRGLSDNEMKSAVTSVHINVLAPKANNVIDAPYHLLQKATIQLFGLTPLAIKLPSVILGVVSGLALIIMLQRWFKRNVAVITAILISTSTGFISVARLGEPLIMTTFWTIILLLASTFVLHGSRASFMWKIVCFLSVGLLLYSPLGIYPLIAMLVAGVLHPHVRHRLKQGKWWQFTVIAVAFGVAVTPLIVAIVNNVQVGLELLGISNLSITFDRLYDAARTVSLSLFNFTQSHIGEFSTPLFGLISATLLLLGVLKLFTVKHSARSYMLFIWLALLVPVLLLNPSAVLMTIAPAALIMAIGVETLIREWYGLFPRNPYARIAALVPLTILLASVVMTNVERYYYNNHYSPAMSHVFHAELPVVRSALGRNDINHGKMQLVVPDNQVAFYDILRREYKNLSVSPGLSEAGSKGTLLVTANSPEQPAGLVPYRILTNDLSTDAALLRIYTSW